MTDPTPIVLAEFVAMTPPVLHTRPTIARQCRNGCAACKYEEARTVALNAVLKLQIDRDVTLWTDTTADAFIREANAGQDGWTLVPFVKSYTEELYVIAFPRRRRSTRDTIIDFVNPENDAEGRWIDDEVTEKYVRPYQKKTLILYFQTHVPGQLPVPNPHAGE